MTGVLRHVGEAWRDFAPWIFHLLGRPSLLVSIVTLHRAGDLQVAQLCLVLVRFAQSFWLFPASCDFPEQVFPFPSSTRPALRSSPNVWPRNSPICTASSVWVIQDHCLHVPQPCKKGSSMHTWSFSPLCVCQDATVPFGWPTVPLQHFLLPLQVA